MDNCKAEGNPFYMCSCMWDEVESKRGPAEEHITVTTPNDIGKLGEAFTLAVKHCKVRGA